MFNKNSFLKKNVWLVKIKLAKKSMISKLNLIPFLAFSRLGED